MQDAAPAPVLTAEEKRAARRADIARLRKVLVDVQGRYAVLADVHVDHQGRQRALEQAINQVSPGAVASVQAAVREFEGGRLTWKEWLSVHLPDWVSEAAGTTLVMAFVLLCEMYMNPRPPVTGVLSGLGWPAVMARGATPMLATPNKSVVDEVFAKAKATNRMRERPRPPTN